MPTVREDVKAYTGEERLIDLLTYHYQLTIHDVEPIGGILKIKSDQGMFVLKRVQENEKDRWQLMSELKEYISQDKITNIQISTPLLTSFNRNHFDGYRYSYILLPWIEAELVRLIKPQEWKRVTSAIAEFHQVSKGFTPSQSIQRIRNIRSQSETWKQIYQELEIFHLAAKLTSIPSDVDRLWLETAIYTMSLIENLMDYYNKINGDQISEQLSSQGKVCHGNLHRRNILFEPDQKQITFIDWNRVRLDIRTRDIAQWLLYAYGRTGSKEVITNLIKSYQDISSIDENEHSFIYASILFPEKLSKTIWSFYYDQTLEETSALSSIRYQSQIEQRKLNLIRDYVEVLEQDFNITIPKIEWIHR